MLKLRIPPRNYAETKYKHAGIRNEGSPDHTISSDSGQEGSEWMREEASNPSKPGSRGRATLDTTKKRVY